MRLATFTDPDERTRCRAVSDGHETVALAAPGHERSYFESAGPRAAPPSQRRADGALRGRRARLRAPIVPKKFFHTSGNFREHEEESKNVDWSHEIAPWIVFFQNVDAIALPTSRSSTPSTLTDGARLRARARGRDREARKLASAKRTASEYIGGYVIFNDITARGHPARREMRSGVFSFCWAIDSFCPLALDRDRPTRFPTPLPRDGAARERRAPPALEHGPACRSRSPRSSPTTRRSATAPATSYLHRGPSSGVAGLQRRGGLDSTCAPATPAIEAEIELIGEGLRNPVDLLAGGMAPPPRHRVSWCSSLAARRGQARSGVGRTWRSPSSTRSSCAPPTTCST